MRDACKGPETETLLDTFVAGVSTSEVGEGDHIWAVAPFA